MACQHSRMADDKGFLWVRPEANKGCMACVQRTLEKSEMDALMAAEHKPNFILRIMTELIWQADLQEGQSMRLDETLSFFEEQIGTCERCVACPGKRF